MHLFHLFIQVQTRCSFFFVMCADLRKKKEQLLSHGTSHRSFDLFRAVHSSKTRVDNPELEYRL